MSASRCDSGGRSARLLSPGAAVSLPKALGLEASAGISTVVRVSGCAGRKG